MNDRRPVPLLKNSKLFGGNRSDWVFVNKKCQASRFFTKITKFLPNLITNILFLLFKLAPSFNCMPMRPGCL